MSKGKPPSIDERGYEQPAREYGGWINKRNLLAGTAVVLVTMFAVYQATGVTIETEQEKPEPVRPPNFDGVQIPDPPPPQEEAKAEPPPPAEAAPAPRNERRQARPQQQPRQRPAYTSVLAFKNRHTETIMSPMLQGSGASSGRAGGVQMAGMAEGTGDSRGRGGKDDFYKGGGGRSKQSLYHQHSLQPELDGCVVKAGEEIIVQNPNPVRTELPGQVRGIIVEDVLGRIYHQSGQIEECLAVPAGSTTMVEVNSGSVSRGDYRVQMCSTRIDLIGGGIMPMECSPTLGQDGAFGVEAESEYAWGGIATGILVEAALSTVSSLGSIIQGPAGVAVQVGTQGIEGAGSEYVRRELMRPPVLTMKPGAIYRIQVNSDISFPE